jgi:hypothetical protein
MQSASNTINAEVRLCESKILASARFSRCKYLKRFIHFTVEETLAGRGPSLKEHSIAVEVLDRPESFDARLDPVVRVQARRLRGKMSRYYQSEGASDPIRILYKPGQYAPGFQSSEATDDPAGSIVDMTFGILILGVPKLLIDLVVGQATALILKLKSEHSTPNIAQPEIICFRR